MVVDFVVPVQLCVLIRELTCSSGDNYWSSILLIMQLFMLIRELTSISKAFQISKIFDQPSVDKRLHTGERHALEHME